MHISAVLIRFFKSFNYDFLRKHHPDAAPEPWEMVDGTWFPFVRVPLMRDITTVVGANESGKSHLLGAIEKGLSGEEITRRDFCRYSQFFTVEEGKMRWPDFGFQFSGLTSQDQEHLKSATGIKHSESIDRFTLIRSNRNDLEVWIYSAGEWTRHKIADPATFFDSKLLPKVFHIDSKVALPGSVPLSWLRGDTERRWSRSSRRNLMVAMDGLSNSLRTAESVKGNASNIASRFAGILNGQTDSAGQSTIQMQRACQLAKDLLFTVARVDTSAIQDLSDAISQEDEGLANGILQQINQRLATALNFPKWWVQDRDFRLTVSARDDDLVFTVSDRTQTEYSFGERSNGLRYFLSYYIQHLAHVPPSDQQEILLMDEPDAFLSSQGQQDLLKIFNSFAHPEDSRPPVQVVYVTHSPFLIDRNHSERIRVLEKGTDDEGTRVVNDASKNHYEPLRSSFGAYVAETTFIGNCNLMVEGLADQVLLAGSSTFLRTTNSPRMKTLDLNRITVVPAGSASHIPYLVYLARGRDVEQPSVIVLLDSDTAGKDARKELQRGGPRRKQLIRPEYVQMVGDLSSVELPDGNSQIETEDLIPPELAAQAAQRYLRAVRGISDVDVAKITAEDIIASWTNDSTLFDAIGKVVRVEIGDDAHVDKVGFARAVIDVIQELHAIDPHQTAVKTFRHNMEILLATLARLQRQAERDTAQERISRRIDRATRAFLRDHVNSCEREDAILLLEELDSVLDDSREADEVRHRLLGLRRDHELSEIRPGPIADFERFRDDLLSVRYSGLNAVQVEQPHEAILTEPKGSLLADAPASSGDCLVGPQHTASEATEQ